MISTSKELIRVTERQEKLIKEQFAYIVILSAVIIVLLGMVGATAISL